MCPSTVPQSNHSAVCIKASAWTLMIVNPEAAVARPRRRLAPCGHCYVLPSVCDRISIWAPHSHEKYCKRHILVWNASVITYSDHNKICIWPRLPIRLCFIGNQSYCGPEHFTSKRRSRTRFRTRFLRHTLSLITRSQRDLLPAQPTLPRCYS
jgi:hypothetical protein